MRKLVCDTSVFQYLHQLRHLYILKELPDCCILVPPAVVDELQTGRAVGVDLPNIEEIGWIEVRHPEGEKDVVLITDLGPGEAQVLMLTVEGDNTIAVLDDMLARKIAKSLGQGYTGTLGLLLDAKRNGLIPEIRPLLEELDNLRFHITKETKGIILKMADEC